MGLTSAISTYSSATIAPLQAFIERTCRDIRTSLKQVTILTALNSVKVVIGSGWRVTNKPYCTFIFDFLLHIKVYYCAMRTKILSFTPSEKLQKSLKATQSEMARLAAQIEQIDPDEHDWLHRWAMISTVGASTRIENAVLTDAEIEWVDTTLTQQGHTTAFESKKQRSWTNYPKTEKEVWRKWLGVVSCYQLSMFNMKTFIRSRKRLFEACTTRCWTFTQMANGMRANTKPAQTKSCRSIMTRRNNESY